MTREEAREILTHNWTRVDNPNYSESELDEAFFMAIEALKTIDNCDQCEWCCPLDGTPTTSVVRCKECRHRYEEGDNTHYYWCRLNDRPIDDTDYCAWAERREP